MSELLPCPFCGPAKRKPVFHKDKGVKCHTCGAWGPAWEKPTGEEWNTRAALDAILAKAREDALREVARLTDGQLVARCADAWEQAPVGSTWEHRKGGVYVVKGVALTSGDLTPVVVYQKTTGNGPAFTRPADEFLDGRFRAIAEGKDDE